MRVKKVMSRRLMSTAADITKIWTYSGNTAVLTLNRPSALNPLTEEICLELKHKLIDWRKSPEVSSFIVKGNGKAFCAGGDIKALWQALSSANTNHTGTGMPGTADGDFFRQEYEMNYLLGISKVPQVSLWDGIVMGGGVGLSVYGDFRIATERALFAMPECSIGIFPDVGSSSWIPKMTVPGMGLYVALTGCRLGAGDLLHTGLATHFVSSDRLSDLESEIVAMCSKVPQDDLQRTKARAIISGILGRYHGSNPVQPSEERSVLPRHIDIIARCFSGQRSVEDIMHCLNSELDLATANDKNTQEWIEKTLSMMRKQPPTSLELTWALLEEAEHSLRLDLKLCLEAEYRLMMRCMKEPNFKEGIRAALIDKDGAPVWTPRTLGEVRPEVIRSYFEGLGDFELDLDQYRR